ncbi:DNA polymerase III subunit gamma/tau [Oceanisphaera pacifica]|uniref:DNA polymerase III subunit gamma/tau n=1 Tax=Oceanisphaera pacifica TaxID=2818389 RepID=A0ABS3NDS5_9GAMM|nr:DNA polymerase III subunit gamma/tau [Oceanisphaera pacifica]MBO1518739.1 DNA polymerase III subunit gamma/tau [Oceanisphaera pacifica]
MNYQVLARKWRPQRFADVVGQQHVLTALINALSQGRLHHAYLFSGTRGVGKTSIARLLAKALNCDHGITPDPCGSCASCQEIEQGRFVDLLEIDAASRTKVEDTRELLDNVQYQPARGRFKVYLIDEVHMLSRHSFNALLKTLEEPPPHVKFLLATTDPQKLPITILSRCLQFHLKSLEPEQIDTQLQHILEHEQLPFEAQATAALSRAADGSLRDGLSLTDQALAFGNGEVKLAWVESMLGNLNRSQLLALIEAILSGQGDVLLAQVAELASLGPDYDQVHKELIGFWHQLALAQLVAASPQQPYAEELNRLAPLVSSEQIQVFYQICLQGRKDLPFAPDGRSALEMTLLRTLAFRPEAPVVTTNVAFGSLASAVPKEVSPTVKKPEPPPIKEAPSTPAAHEPTAASLEQEQNEIWEQAARLGQASPSAVASEQPSAGTAKAALPDEALHTPISDNESKAAVTPAPVAKPSSADAIEDPAAADVARLRRLLQTRNRLRSQEPDKAAPAPTVTPIAKPSVTPTAPPVQATQSQAQVQDQEPIRAAEKPSIPASGASRADELPPLDAYDDANWQNEDQDLPPWHADGQSTQATPLAPSTAQAQASSRAEAGQLQRTAQPQPASSVVPNVAAHAPAGPLTKAQHSASDPEPLKAISLLPQAEDSWTRLVAELPLGGLLRQLAMHSSREEITEQQWQLWLQPQHKHLLNEKSRQELESVIQQHISQPITVLVTVGQQTGLQTPFEIEQVLYQAAIAQAKDEIKGDDAVQFLISRFAAVLDEDSIEPMVQ